MTLVIILFMHFCRVNENGVLSNSSRRLPTQTALTIGTFDGIHLGHQALIQKTQLIAKRHGIASAVVLFEPHPKEWFLQDQAPPRLSFLQDKLRYLAEFDIDYVICIRFNHTIAQLSPEAFVQRILLSALNAQHIIVGQDFRYGAKRQGDVAHLKTMADSQGIEVCVLQDQTVDGKRVSSSNIRQQLINGHFKNAQQLLGRDFQIIGKVRHGDKKGRHIGFRTLNIPLSRPFVLSGVYVVKAYINDTAFFGMANVGVRPTVDGHKRLLEVHLFNATGDFYGQPVCVCFLHFLRPEIKFTGLDALKAQLNHDKLTANQWLNESNLMGSIDL